MKILLSLFLISLTLFVYLFYKTDDLDISNQKGEIKMEDGKILIPKIEQNFLIKESEKKRIDKWLEDNQLNEYGDSKETMYLGGTPLFDEKTGKNLNRYEYILKNHPELRK